MMGVSDLKDVICWLQESDHAQIGGIKNPDPGTHATNQIPASMQDEPLEAWNFHQGNVFHNRATDLHAP